LDDNLRKIELGISLAIVTVIFIVAVIKTTWDYFGDFYMAVAVKLGIALIVTGFLTSVLIYRYLSNRSQAD
jgi:hypothetical protein